MKKWTEPIAAFFLAGVLAFAMTGIIGCGGPTHDPSAGGKPAPVIDGEDGDGGGEEDDED